MNCVAVNNKGVVFEVFTGLDIVLILIRPVQLHFLALIGNSVHAFLVPSLGNEIAILIIAIEEGIQRRIHVCLQRGQISAFRKLFLELQILLLFLRGVGEGIHSHAHF